MPYLIYKDNQEVGPLEDEVIRERLSTGELLATDYLWDEEKQDWAVLSSLFSDVETPPASATIIEDSPIKLGQPVSGTQEEASPEGDTDPAVAQAESTQKLRSNKSDATWEQFTKEKQSKGVVRSIYPRVKELCTSDEEILFIGVQKKPLSLNLSPESLIITNRRLILFQKHLFKIDYDDYSYREVQGLHFKETLLGSHLTFTAGAGQVYGIYYLPKTQGRQAFNVAKKQHETYHQQNAQHQTNCQANVPNLPQAQAAQQQANAQRLPANQNPLAHIPQASITQTIAQVEDPQDKLTKLKNLLDQSLITQEDYDKKKHQILDSL